MFRTGLAITLSLIAWLFLACAPQTGGNGGGGQNPAGTPGAEPPIPPEAQEAVAAAKQELAGRTGKPAEKLTVVSIERVDWRDASLGCPEPGKLYIQVITPGYRIVLSDGNNQYEYHSDTRGRVVACTGGR